MSNLSNKLDALYQQEAELESKLSQVRAAIRECVNHMNLNKHGEESSLQHQKNKEKKNESTSGI